MKEINEKIASVLLYWLHSVPFPDLTFSHPDSKGLGIVGYAVEEAFPTSLALV
jgi:hypothetical protein